MYKPKWVPAIGPQDGPNFGLDTMSTTPGDFVTLQLIWDAHWAHLRPASVLHGKCMIFPESRIR